MPKARGILKSTLSMSRSLLLLLLLLSPRLPPLHAACAVDSGGETTRVWGDARRGEGVPEEQEESKA